MCHSTAHVSCMVLANERIVIFDHAIHTIIIERPGFVKANFRTCGVTLGPGTSAIALIVGRTGNGIPRHVRVSSCANVMVNVGFVLILNMGLISILD